jgi:phosphomannomutase
LRQQTTYSYHQMTLITSISGIRGTIGGVPGTGLTPPDITGFVTAFTALLRRNSTKDKITVVLGRDGRSTGQAVSNLVCGVLQLCGADVIDLGLSTTPSVELAVPYHKADGGIILTASHNPAEWNALKLLSHTGEFISEDEGNQLLAEASSTEKSYPDFKFTGNYTTDPDSIARHITAVAALPFVDRRAIENAGFTVAFDSVNSTGGIALPALLTALGVNRIIPLNDEPTGQFAHNPEPLPENLKDLSELVVRSGADVGFAVDPDVDRLAMICEDGSPFGEEYTLVAVADYILGKKPGNTVSNLSSSRALRDITLSHGGSYSASAVGEVNVVAEMKATNAVIGGEGNGGVILPALHYGRDALAGIALFLSYLALRGETCSSLRRGFPGYFICKRKFPIKSGEDISGIFKKLESAFPEAIFNRTDGLKIDLPQGWIHLRKSNTEPIVRVYAEASDESVAEELIDKAISVVQS